MNLNHAKPQIPAFAGPGVALLHVGMDDTDSVRGMCTTYLAYSLARRLRKAGAEFRDYPRLVRLNPNVPWKTRGNGAVSITVDADPGAVWEAASAELELRSDLENGASPGLAMCEGPRPPELEGLARRALHGLVNASEAERLASGCGARTLALGGGRGLVGALSCIGYRFGDCTAELVCYRRPEMAGTPRRISAESVRAVQEGHASTFSSFDEKRKRQIISPRGPDPVLYGLRGESPRELCRARAGLETGEEPLGHMVFRTNQGTGDHMRRALGPRSEPYSSGVLEGRVCAAPRTGRGGHVFFAVSSGGGRTECAAYKPGGLGGPASMLLPGDVVRVGGGVRPPSGLGRVLNAEFIEAVRLAPDVHEANPSCGACGKSMKSKGRGQGFACGRCATSSPSRVRASRPRGLSAGTYLPFVSAQRHLTRPAKRAGLYNRFGFDRSLPWIV